MIFKFAKATVNDDKYNLQAVLKSAPKNIVAAMIIFLVPYLVSMVVKISFPNSDYKNCLTVKTVEQIQEIYTEKIEKLVSTAEESLNINDYTNAMNYLSNIKDEDIRKVYEESLKSIKEKIDNSNVVVSDNLFDTYDKVNYSNFKLTYYDRAKGPLNSYYASHVPYTIWAPENIDDLNGVSLPLIVFLHGAGETTDKLPGEYFLKNGVSHLETGIKI